MLLVWLGLRGDGVWPQLCRGWPGLRWLRLLMSCEVAAPSVCVAMRLLGGRACACVGRLARVEHVVLVVARVGAPRPFVVWGPARPRPGAGG